MSEEEKSLATVEEGPEPVMISCPHCRHIWAIPVVSPVNPGVRHYTCKSCRFSWVVNVGGSFVKLE